MTTEPFPRSPFAPPAGAPVAPDDATAQRLARLAARRPAAAPTATDRSSTGSPRPVRAAGWPGRHHAAKGARAGALLMSLATTGGLTAFFAQQASTAAAGTSADGTVSAAATTAAVATDSTVVPSSASTVATTAATTDVTTAAGAPTAASTSAATTSAVATGTAAATATYSGTAVSTRYGAVQVAITVSGGTITDVKTLAAPSGGKNDKYTTRSVPVLRTEALAAQSADIDIVTGATYTSKGYITSLQSAIDQAVSAGVLASA
jgi:uncharacterized protein with FMN-binding domain